MGTDLSITPAGALAPVTVPAPVMGAAADAVATELPPSQTVTAANASAAAPAATQQSAPTASSDLLSHQVILDPEAATIVYKTIDERNDRLLDQYPDAATLRRRAYYHTLDLQSEKSPGNATDRRA